MWGFLRELVATRVGSEADTWVDLRAGQKAHRWVGWLDNTMVVHLVCLKDCERDSHSADLTAIGSVC